MRVELYSEKHKESWDNFVSQSKNGTFLFYRDFMEYHKHKFNDFSLLFYKGETLVALLPGNLKEQTFYSHQGLSYGGLIMDRSTTTTLSIEVFEHFTTILRQQGVKEIIYKAIPHIYHTMPAEEDLYALFVNKAQVVGRGISSALLLSQDHKYSTIRKRGIKKAQTRNLRIEENQDIHSFWNILEENLHKRYNTKPVHSLEEISLLKERFPSNIIFLGVYSNENEILAGSVLFITSKVVHLQYIAASNQGKESGATDLLIDYIINKKWNGQIYFDYGISTENNGLYLNQGLINHKEGFGARGIAYDIYSIKLN